MEAESGVVLVGFGPHMRSCLLPALRRMEIPVTGVITRHPKAIREQARRHGIPEGLGAIEALRRAPAPRAVIVAAGYRSHLEILRALKDVPAPVFIEKPVAESAAQLREFLHADPHSDALVMVGFQKRYAPAYVQVKRMIGEKRISQAVHLDYGFQVGRLGKGLDFLLEVGIHGVDLLRFLLGPMRILQALEERRDDRVHYTVLLQSDGGVSATLHVGEMAEWSQAGERLEITGTGHQVVVENLTDFEWRRPYPGPAGVPDIETGGRIAAKANFPVPITESGMLYQHGYLGELQHFFDCVHSGRSPQPDLEDALATMELLEAIRREACASCR